MTDKSKNFKSHYVCDGCLSDYEVDRQESVEPQKPMYFREKQENGKYQYIFSGMVYCMIHGCHMGRRARDKIAIDAIKRGDDRRTKLMQFSK